jgi:hypothetical protein
MKPGDLNLLESSRPLQNSTGIILSLPLPSLFYGNHMDLGILLVSYTMDTAVFSPIFNL